MGNNTTNEKYMCQESALFCQKCMDKGNMSSIKRQDVKEYSSGLNFYKKYDYCVTYKCSNNHFFCKLVKVKSNVIKKHNKQIIKTQPTKQ